MIKKTKTGLYTTETVRYDKVITVNVFHTKEEAMKTLSLIDRIKNKFNEIKVIKR